MQHWKEDFMFGYQYLNGCNPVMIQKCTKLPEKFPVTHDMVADCLEREMTLEEEIKVETEPIEILFNYSNSLLHHHKSRLCAFPCRCHGLAISLISFPQCITLLLPSYSRENATRYNKWAYHTVCPGDSA